MCVCVRACVCVCACVILWICLVGWLICVVLACFFHIILHVNCFGRTVLYMCIEYQDVYHVSAQGVDDKCTLLLLLFGHEDPPVVTPAIMT